MNSFIPDTMQGALILSVIDFFLSFVVISFIGFVLAGFPLLNSIAERLARAPEPEKKVESAPVSAPVADSDVPIEHVIAISAAVAAMVGEHRILNIEPTPSSTRWSLAGRLAHHNSHNRS